MPAISLTTKVPLQNGCGIPILGLGTWKMTEGRETEEALRWALEAGYRHIDTAKLYGNERSVGNAVRASGIAREELFVMTKLWPTDFLRPEKAFRESLDRLNLGYIDLYLVHWPLPIMPKKIWQTLEGVYAQGLARAIGVSNYDIDDIERVLAYAKIAPMVNQVKFHPVSHDAELIAYCKDKNIVVEAYSPLGQGSLVRNAVVRSIAETYQKTPAQILIRWALDHGTVPLPKSSNRERIIENTEVFDFALRPQDMETLNTLS